MEELTQLMTYLASIATAYPWLLYTLAGLGGAYVVLTVAQPLVLGIAHMTKTEKDDRFFEKLYAFLTKYGPCFKPAAELFKKQLDEKAAKAREVKK